MSRRRSPVPSSFRGSAALTRDHELHGMSAKRVRGDDLQHPFHGVVAAGLDLESVVAACRAYLPRLGPRDVFSHSTAAQLFDTPLVDAAAAVLPIHITTLDGRPRHGRNMIGHESRAPLPVVQRFGLPVVSPATSWCQLGALLSRDELVVVADRLLTGSRSGAGLQPALCTLDELRAMLATFRGHRGTTRLAWAIERSRAGAQSRPETLLRLLLVGARLPEPTLQHPIAVAGGRVVHPDLAYPDARTAIEYEGDEHRADRRRWRDDVTRYELLHDAGWRVLRVHAGDLFGDPSTLVRRVRAALAAGRTHPNRPKGAR